MLHKGKVFIHWLAGEHYGTDGGKISYDNYDWTPREGHSGLEGYTLIGTVDIECEVSDIDARQKLVEKLQREKSVIIIEATRKAEHLEEKIQQLLALPSGQSVIAEEYDHLF